MIPCISAIKPLITPDWIEASVDFPVNAGFFTASINGSLSVKLCKAENNMFKL